MRIIILENQNLSKTFYKNYELKYKKKKIDFQFWSLLPLTNKKLFKIYSKKKYRIISHPKFIIIKSYKHLFKKINGIKGKTCFINQLGESFFSCLIELFLIKKGCLKIKNFELGISGLALSYKANIYEDFKRTLSVGNLFVIKKIIWRLIAYCIVF